MFVSNSAILRQINRSFASEWEGFAGSRTHAALVDAGLLVRSEVEDLSLALTDEAAYVIRPEQIPFISYPYEWCFSQLRDAALTTLEAMKEAMEHGYWLRDASAYNVQFLRGKPLLIDSLSFEQYEEGKPWIAYGQFCRHFLAPLTLMALVDLRLGGLLRVHLDGIPLDLASHLLPAKTRLSPGLLTHIHLHAAAGAGKGGGPSKVTVPKAGLLGMIDSLLHTVESLHAPHPKTVWGEYYDNTNYTKESFEAKKQLVAEMADLASPKTIWDLGANTGVFSECIAGTGRTIVSWDGDPMAVEQAYVQWRQAGTEALLPLLQDFANPSPSQGWAHEERESFASRGPADLCLALALVHHLAIGNNVPLRSVASWLAGLGEWSLVEFVPKEDSQVQRMLTTRKDIFVHYNQEGFEAAFGIAFEFVRSELIPGTKRTLYLMKRRDGSHG